MPNARTENAVRLEFAPGSLVQSNLSGAAFTGEPTVDEKTAAGAAAGTAFAFDARADSAAGGFGREANSSK